MGKCASKAYQLPNRKIPTEIPSGFMHNWCAANTCKHLLNWYPKEISLENGHGKCFFFFFFDKKTVCLHTQFEKLV